MKDGFKVLFLIFLRNVIIPGSMLMLGIWFVVLLFGGGALHLEVLITGLVGLIGSIILTRKL